MVNLPAARRHHRSRIGYAFGLLALLGAATALAVAGQRDPALSSTQQLTEPVPAPEITVAGEAPHRADEPDEPGWAGPAGADALGAPAGTGCGPGRRWGRRRARWPRDAPSRSDRRTADGRPQPVPVLLRASSGSPSRWPGSAWSAPDDGSGDRVRACALAGGRAWECRRRSSGPRPAATTT